MAHIVLFAPVFDQIQMDRYNQDETLHQNSARETKYDDDFDNAIYDWRTKLDDAIAKQGHTLEVVDAGEKGGEAWFIQKVKDEDDEEAAKKLVDEHSFIWYP